MKSLKRFFVWLSRWNKCRGFGVQSPWAYQMIRYVINEHWPYYAYELFENHVPKFSESVLKLGCLYFRLSNFRQPDKVLCYPDAGEYEQFFKCGCRKSGVDAVGSGFFSDENVTTVELLRISPVGDYQKVFEEALKKVDEQSVVIIEDIHRDRPLRDFWKHVVDDDRVVISFDLYYCGIIFFQKRRYKENYIVNF